jgi:hypothetical protein
MHTRHCQKLADRIHRLLKREIGQGLDRQRMLADPLYARDALLVCEALRHTDGPNLARHYRRAAEASEEGSGEERRGFSASRWLGSLFGGGSSFGELEDKKAERVG